MQPPSAGTLVKSFRVARRLTQEKLAELADTSPRHLSCIENGKVFASQSMLLELASALDLPFRSRNNLLVAGGYAPAYSTLTLSDEALRPVREAMTHMLKSHEPHPAILLDRRWNIVELNQGAQKLFQWLALQLPPDEVPNVLKLVLDPRFELRGRIENFEHLAQVMLSRLRLEAEADASLSEFLGEVEALSRASKAAQHVPQVDAFAAQSVCFRRGAQALRYFMTLTTLGTALDITSQELRLESYFPLDAETRAFASGKT
jgi:transcriptional regulator with XRE-family HTH domain